MLLTVIQKIRTSSHHRRHLRLRLCSVGVSGRGWGRCGCGEAVLTNVCLGFSVGVCCVVLGAGSRV